ncbi:fumarylacetoacetate hydrolase family protein [Bacillus daqingensis]|uniref:Fumarylacetoacetate hydrolase family protein n=1 Tax=Bacillus daqingensis TaxID=872396 RepID=A0ABV9P020_9BACI
MDIRNIYCVGRNYADHAKELGNEVPDAPMLFMKPTHALAHGADKTLDLPEDAGEVHYETELVVLFKDTYSPDKSLQEMIGQTAVGIDFTLRDRQEKLKQKRHPWLAAKGFKYSAAVGPFFPFDEKQWQHTTFRLEKNHEVVQEGSPAQMIFSLRELVDFTGPLLGIGPGDLLYTGTPEGVGKVQKGDELVLFYNNQKAGTFRIQSSE